MNLGTLSAALLITLFMDFTQGYPAESTVDGMETTVAYTDYPHGEISNHTHLSNGTTSDGTPSTRNNAMSIMWYLVSFGGLVTFFLLLSFSEFCCRQKRILIEPTIPEADLTAPPPYENFAPPNYDSLFRNISKGRKMSIRASVFLVPVHDKAELPKESPLEFGEVIRRNPMGDGEVVTPPPPP